MMYLQTAFMLLYVMSQVTFLRLCRCPTPLCYCNDTYEIFKDFVGILPCDEWVASEALLKYIRDLLTRCCIPSEKMAGMAFDEASPMKNCFVERTSLKACIVFSLLCPLQQIMVWGEREAKLAFPLIP